MAYAFGQFEAFTAAFGAIGSTYGGTGTLYTMLHGAYYSAIILNSLDNPIAISFDGGTTTAFYLAAAEPIFLNMFSMGLALKKGLFTAKYTGSAPTSGSLRGTLVYKHPNI